MESFYHLVSVLLSLFVLFPYTCHPSLVHYPISNMHCIDSERDALLQFKHGIDIDSDFLGLLTSWRRHTDCCQWRGVRCSNQTGHVIRLSLADGGLQGKVSPSLGKLNHLKHLNLSYNDFQGEIPQQLGNLSKLTSLDLKSSFLYMPENVKNISWISRLSMLRYLDLSSIDYLSQVKNWMTIVSNLPSLRVLRMDSCLLLPIENPSSLSYLNSSTSLHTISLSYNCFSDSSIFKWLSNLPRISTQLEYLDLSWNKFEIPIPSDLANFHTLSYLSLANNEFQGSVHKTIYKLCNLRQLYLGNNHFADELVDVIQSIVNCENKELLTLDLGHNSISGTIPDSISSFSSLKELHLNDNKLKGEISQGIGELTMLEILDLSHNNISGTIPDSIGELTMLEILDVSSNSLEGTLTHTFFSNLSHLRELDLSSNLRVVVKIGEDWIPPFQLDVVNLRSCNLGPHYPKWLTFKTKNVSYFDVSDNGISDTIPVSFWNSLSSNCIYLNLSHNQFYGVFPNPPDGLFYNLQIIDMSSNLLEGIVPSAFAYGHYLYLNDNRFIDCSNILCPNLSFGLSVLELSNNLFSGELPDCWMNLNQLTSLHLENNRFSGRIPKSMGTLSYLNYLHLYNNSFSGPFPSAFENCTSLVMLNLGYNLFTGYIPPWIGNNFGDLTSLILRKNHFIGEIHESICQISNLQILDLSGNHISGVIPSCIGNFTAMNNILGPSTREFSIGFNNYEFIETETSFLEWKREEHLYKETFRLVSYIDLSNNELSGEIPDGISNLTTLGALDLSKNKLSGSIPSSIGKMTALELLDLSNNLLTGKIPTSLADVTTFGILDVSNNNLSGEIPVSTQLQSFDASSYAGNRGLCGMPLPSCSPSNVPNRDNTSGHGKDDDFGFFLGLYISMTLGFIVGFWGVCGTLVIKTSWRYAYFRFLDNIKDRVF